MVKFNHCASTLQESMGIPDRRADELTASLFFEMISVQHMVETLFDNPDEAPANMTTKTGILERVLEDTKNEQEQIYVTWEYAKYDALKRNDDFAMKHGLMTMSLFMYSNQDKDKFVQTYVTKKQQAQSDDTDD